MNAFQSSFAMPLRQPPAKKSRQGSEASEYMMTLSGTVDSSLMSTSAVPELEPATIPKLTRANSFGSQTSLHSDSGMRRKRSSTCKVRSLKPSALPRSPLRVEHFSDGNYFDHALGVPVMPDSVPPSPASTDAGRTGRSTPPTPNSAYGHVSTMNAEPIMFTIAPVTSCSSEASGRSTVFELASLPVTPFADESAFSGSESSTITTVEPRPQRVTDFARIFDLASPPCAVDEPVKAIWHFRLVFLWS